MKIKNKPLCFNCQNCRYVFRQLVWYGTISDYQVACFKSRFGVCRCRYECKNYIKGKEKCN